MLSFLSHGVLEMGLDLKGGVLSFWSHDLLDLKTDFNNYASVCRDYSLQEDAFPMFCAVSSIF